VPPEPFLEAAYDFIVCGGGTTGCVVARRLAENPSVQVLLLEAGADERLDAVNDPTRWMSHLGSERDWQFAAEASPALCGRRAALPMGKVLGGGSSINGLIWARGHKHDFDFWAQQTSDASWSYESVLEIYRRIESWDGPPDSLRRGSSGPVYVTRAQDPIPLTLSLIDATAAAGIPEAADLNGEVMEGSGGCGIANITVKEARRVSMASAYLRPVMHQNNLNVLLQAEVRRLRFKGSRVIGVEFTYQGQMHKVGASCEVILSMGAINTPKILMLSGIGEQRELRRHGITPLQHLPGVGQNFQDHILVAGCVWEYRIPQAPRNNSAEFTFFCKSDARLPTPDLQPVLEERAFGSEVNRLQYALPEDPAAAWTLAPGLVRPESRGHITLNRNDPNAAPEIHANFLSDQRDVTALLRAIDVCREIGNSSFLREFARRELMPGPLSAKQMELWLRQAAGTYFHQSGSAKMGRDETSVVDGSLCVYGVQALRIADASVMPTITTGNTMAPCVMIGERAADLLRAAHAA
jgi:choline dehydrogenase